MSRPPPLLPADFFRRSVATVARELLGMEFVRDEVRLRITEVEAYGGPEDSASHARFGPTERNSVMFGPAGRAYVFLCYGTHHLLNVVARGPEAAGAVLIRACEPLDGREVLQRRRSGRTGRELLCGPGRVGAALGVDRTWTGHVLYRRGGLELRRGLPPRVVLVGPRVGIDYAQEADRSAPLRFASGDSDWVTRRRGLRPESAVRAGRRRRV